MNHKSNLPFIAEEEVDRQPQPQARVMTYGQYHDRVWGCWLGKCLCGTMGAPYEGIKQRLELSFDPAMFSTMLPNDDLDLQILWLDVLERKGEYFTSDDLAQAFAKSVPYAPGEYAYFKKNFARGVHPPESGWFNNRYYIEGMGSPIRSEIWGCVAVGNPDLAAQLAELDARLDHRGDSVQAEQFLAAIEAMAFFESDLSVLYEIGLKYVSPDSRLYRLIRDVLAWCSQESDWTRVHTRIVRDYGHPDCTNLYQNIGFTLLALHYGEMDLIKTSLVAVNCGFDTDCTCATAGALLGIILGQEKIKQAHQIEDADFKLSINIERPTSRVVDLATDCCRMGLHFASTVNRRVEITEAPALPPLSFEPNLVDFSVEYCQIPAIAPGDVRDLRVRLHYNGSQPMRVTAALTGPKGFVLECSQQDLFLEPQHRYCIALRVHVPGDIDIIHEKNLFELKLQTQEAGELSYCFGLVGATVWEVFGPFWENEIILSPEDLKQNYFGFLRGHHEDETTDRLRKFHLSTIADLHKPYLAVKDICLPRPERPLDIESRQVYLYEDKFDVCDLVDYQGPCVVYAYRRLISPRDCVAHLMVGHSDAFKVWINEELIAQSEECGWWTAENCHLSGIRLRKGINHIVCRLVRRGEAASFSLLFTENGACTDHLYDLASHNPQSSV